MRISHFFIDRPIFAAVVSIVFVILGGVSFSRLPIAQYPEIAPPIINVTGQYPGASAEVVAATVVTPIEEQINGVENMLYVSSNSTADGRFSIAVTLRPRHQSRYRAGAGAEPRRDRAAAAAGRRAQYRRHGDQELARPDDGRAPLFARQVARRAVHLQLRHARDHRRAHPRRRRRLDHGVRQPRLFDAHLARSRPPAVARPDRERRHQRAAGPERPGRLRRARPAAGRRSRARSRSRCRRSGRLADPDEFGAIVVKQTPAAVVRLQGRRQDRARRAGLFVELLSRPRSGGGARDLPAARLECAGDRRGRHATMDELSKRFPPGIKYAIVYDPTQFIQQSVNAVVETIGEAIMLVVLVVILFLQTWRAAVIPLVAIPVSLIGTFFFMAVFGFTLNNLSLFGLVLAIGIVVDDAIVVVENVERNIAAGLAPRDAARKSMDEVGSALVAIALVLCAVFVPSAFITGISGQFYRQFALTIAGATVISLIVSLTLSPAMCALLLKPHDAEPPRPLVGAADPRLLRAASTAASTASADGYRWLAARDRAPRRDHAGRLSRRARRSASTSSARRRSASSRRSTAATSSSWCSCRRARRWRAPTRCSSARSISRSACRASRTPSTSSASPARPSPMRPMPARSSWCSIRSRSAPRIRASRRPASRPSCSSGCRRSRTPSSSWCCRRRWRGIGNAGGFRMMVEDRAGRGSAGAAAGGRRA